MTYRLFTVLCAGILAASAAVANPLHHRHHGGMDDALKALDLTENQHEAIAAIRETARPEMNVAAEALHEARTAMHEFMKSGNYSDADLAAAAVVIGDAEAEMALIKAQTHGDVLRVLTDDQRAQLQELHESHAFARHGRGHSKPE